MNEYIGYYNGETVDIRASSLYEAKTEALTHFRAPRSRQHMIHVELAEKDGAQVVKVAVD